MIALCLEVCQVGQLLIQRQQLSLSALHQPLRIPLETSNLKRANLLEGLVHLKHLPSIHHLVLERMKADHLLLLHLDRHRRQLRTLLLHFPLEHRQIPVQIHSRPLQVRLPLVLPHLLNKHLSRLARLQAASLLDLNLPPLQAELALRFLNQLLGVGPVLARLLLPLPHFLHLFRWLNQRHLVGRYLRLVLRPPHQ